MEMSAYSSIAVLSSCFVLLTLAWKLFNWIWLKPKKLEKLLKQQGFRGNPYRLLFGDLKDISNSVREAQSKPINLSDDIVPRIIPQFHNLVQKYGKKTYIWYGPEPAIFVQDPELLREAAQAITIFHKPEAGQFSRLLTPGLASYNGDKWAKHRKLINPVFNGEKLKTMLPAFQTSASEMMRKWEEIVLPKGSCELDIWPYLQSVTCDAISRTAFGSNYEEGRRIFELQGEQLQHCVKAIWSMFIPGWRFLPTKRNRRMRQIEKEVDDSIRKIVNSRLKAMRAGESCDDDFLGRLLEANSQEIHKHGSKDVGMSTQEVIEECKLFYFAGQETTSVLLLWTMILLSRFQDWQTRAREEVLQLFGTNKPDYDGLNHLKVVTMILYEVLRLYPPLPVNGRRTAAEAKLGNLSIPAGILILKHIALIHYDPELWGDDVKEFKPERFSNGVSNAAKGQAAFFPFGWGPRICTGQNFSMLEAKMVMVKILQRFSFELSPSYSHAPHAPMTIKPQHGAHLILQKL